MDRIEVNPAICSGKPVIRGTRIMVSNILGMVAGGYSVDRILYRLPGSQPRGRERRLGIRGQSG
jgi:uncharacterized protein (DUF433 family)